MATAIKKTTSKTNKTTLEQEVLQKIETALESYKELLGEKKFKNRIKKVGKLFLKGHPKKLEDKKAVPQAKKAIPAKKKAAPKVAKKAAPAKKKSTNH